MSDKHIKCKEIAIQEFTIQSLSSMISCLKICNECVYSLSIKRYCSIVILSIIKLIKDDKCTNIHQMRNLLKSSFIYELSNFYTQDVVKNLSTLKDIKFDNVNITFCIWCIDSFYYFLMNPFKFYDILWKYSSMVKSVIFNCPDNSTLYDMTTELLKLVN